MASKVHAGRMMHHRHRGAKMSADLMVLAARDSIPRRVTMAAPVDLDAVLVKADLVEARANVVPAIAHRRPRVVRVADQVVRA